MPYANDSPPPDYQVEDELNHHDNEEDEPLNLAVVDETEVEVVVPPDGGWGWVVVFASFMCNMILDGILISFALFIKPMAATFNVSDAHVALVGSLMSGFYLIAGPFASALANRYGFRQVAIIGSFLGAASIVLSYFATSVEFLCVTFGVLGGIGFGLIYVPSVITVGFYFERWRALATGIAVCGSGIGMFLFAPLTDLLINALGWQSALLCQGGFVIVCALFGAMFKPLKPTKLKDIEDDNDDKKPELVMDPSKLPTITRLKMEKAMQLMRKRQSIGSVHESQHSIPRMLGVNNNSDYPRVSDVYHTISIPQRRALNIYSQEKRFSVPSISNEDKPKILEGKEPLLSHARQLTRLLVPNHQLDINRPMYRDDIFFSASLTRLHQYTSKSSLQYNLSVTRLPTKNDIDEETKHSCKLCPEAVKRTLATMLDLSLLKSPTFLLLAFGGFITMMGFYVPFMFVSDRAKSSGIDQNSAVFLLSAMGIANTFGRVLCGVLSSFPGVNALFVTNAALTIGGIATIFSGFSMTTEFQYTYTVVFGLSIACFASLRSIIVVDLLGLEKLTNAFGLLLLFQGIAATIGSPLAGAFKVATGSYDASFYLSGSLLLASAIMCYPLNYINRWEMKRNQRLAMEKSVAVPV